MLEFFTFRNGVFTMLSLSFVHLVQVVNQNQNAKLVERVEAE